MPNLSFESTSASVASVAGDDGVQQKVGGYMELGQVGIAVVRRTGQPLRADPTSA